MLLVAVLFTLWICIGQCQRNCPEEKITIYIDIPCLVSPGNSTDGELFCIIQRGITGGLLEPDFFLYSAALLAENHLNARLHNATTVEILAFEHEDIALVLGTLRPLFLERTVHGLIGHSDLFVSYFFTPVVTRRIQIPSITYKATQEDITDSELYYRTIPSTTYITESIVALLEHFQWYKIGIVSTGSLVYRERFNLFAQKYSEHLRNVSNGLITNIFMETFTTEEQLGRTIDDIIQNNIKIIVAFVEEESAVNMLCKARQTGLTGSDTVWILPSYVNPNWWAESCTMCSCTEDELMDVLETVLFVSHSKHLPFGQEVQAHSPEEFRLDLLHSTEQNFADGSMSDSFKYTSTLSPYLPLSNAISAYDAVWTIIVAWERVLSTLDCNNESAENITYALINALSEISDLEYRHLWGNPGCVFDNHSNNSQQYYGKILITQFQSGIISPVALVLPHDRDNGETVVPMVMTNTHSCPTVVEMGKWIRHFYDPSASNNHTYDFKWQGDPPEAGLIIEHSEIPLGALIIVSMVMVVMFALTISVAVFNLVYRENKYIKATSPKLSLGVIFGLLLLLPAPISSGLVSSSHAMSIGGRFADILCWLSYWVSLFGMALLYLTLLVKNYRIYRIFHNKRLKGRENNRLSDPALGVLIILSLVPLIVMCIVSGAYDMIIHREDAIRINEDSTSYHFIEVSHCTSPTRAIQILIYAYINLILAPTLILSLYTMRIPTRFGTEGRGTAGAVLVLIAEIWIIGLIYSTVDIENDPQAYKILFTLIVVFTFIHSGGTLAFLYVPMYYDMYKDHKKMVLVTAMKQDLEEQSKKLEHYRELKSYAADLRKQLDKVEIKLRKLKNKEETAIEISKL